MNPQKWSELARADVQLQDLRDRFTLARRASDYTAAARFKIAIENAEKGRENMVTDITDTLAGDDCIDLAAIGVRP